MRGLAAVHHKSFQSYQRFSRISCAVFLGKKNVQIWEDSEQFFASKQAI